MAQCIEKVNHGGRYGSFMMTQCSKKASAGSKYCKAHDPEIQAVKAQAAQSTRDAEATKLKTLRDFFAGMKIQWHVDTPRHSVRKDVFTVEFTGTEEELMCLASKLKGVL